jgi:putative membrane protein
MLTLATPVLLADSDHWNGPGWWLIFPIFWLVFLCAVIWFIAVGRRRGCRMSGGQQGEARLAERYAAGEIEEQEYRERLSVLREKP